MGTKQRRLPGLVVRHGIWHIDKSLFGKRLRQSTYTCDRKEAEALLARRVTEARRLHFFGEAREHTFREAAAKYLAENQHKRSLDRDRRALAMIDPHIGDLPLARVHHGTLASYSTLRLGRGVSPGTVNRDLAVVRRILTLAARLWRDESDQPWLAVAPLIPMARHPNRREPYPLSVAEQRLLFSELDAHLMSAALFKVNTGLREQEVVQLRWRWEVKIPELKTSIFVVPRDYVKNAMDRYVVLNRTARAVLAKCRGCHPEFVFTYEGRPLSHIYGSGWLGARTRAARRYAQEFGRPCPEGFRRIRVHDLKHYVEHVAMCISRRMRQFLGLDPVVMLHSLLTELSIQKAGAFSGWSESSRTASLDGSQWSAARIRRSIHTLGARAAVWSRVCSTAFAISAGIRRMVGAAKAELGLRNFGRLRKIP